MIWVVIWVAGAYLTGVLGAVYADGDNQEADMFVFLSVFAWPIILLCIASSITADAIFKWRKK